MGAGEAEDDPSANAALRALAEGPHVGAGLRVQVELALAAAAAAEGDSVACDAALAQACAHAERPGAAPELRFDALEKRGQMDAFQNRRGPARAALNALEALTPTLASPFYAARLHLARGEFLASLDPTRARVDLVQARRLFHEHGYADWADGVGQVLDA